MTPSIVGCQVFCYNTGMKEVYLLRHAEKDDQGTLTENGQEMAKKLGKLLPKFNKVISSNSERALLSALLITGVQPQPEERAGYFQTTKAKSDEINAIAAENNISFLDAAETYNNAELLKDIQDKAIGLNQLIDDTLATLSDGEYALILSHDMTISPAMAFRGQPRQPIQYLAGYRIDSEGQVNPFSTQN